MTAAALRALTVLDGARGITEVLFRDADTGEELAFVEAATNRGPLDKEGVPTTPGTLTLWVRRPAKGGA